MTDQNYSNRFKIGQQPLYNQFIDDDELFDPDEQRNRQILTLNEQNHLINNLS